jgi:hypothetical protein
VLERADPRLDHVRLLIGERFVSGLELRQVGDVFGRERGGALAHLRIAMRERERDQLRGDVGCERWLELAELGDDRGGVLGAQRPHGRGADVGDLRLECLHRATLPQATQGGGNLVDDYLEG